MTGLKPISLPSAREKVAAELRKAILSRSIGEGKILTLDAVAAQLNVSVTPVREAFQILAKDALIQLRPNKGAVVLGVNETYIKEHYQLRCILESEAAALCCVQAADISKIQAVFEAGLQDVQARDFSRYADLNRAFHKEIWIASGNRKMAGMLADLWNGLSMGSKVVVEDYAVRSQKEHGQIMDAIVSRDALRAKEEMCRHILRSQEDMLTHYR